MKDNVLLIFPKDNNNEINEGLEEEKYAPLSLLYISIPLLRRGINVEIIDERYEKNINEEIRNKINKKTICLGINLLSVYQIKSSKKIIDFVKKEYPKLKIVFGGSCATVLSYLLLKEDYADIVVLSEGEETFNELISAFKQKKDIARIKGISYKNNKEIIKTEKREITNIDKYVYLPYFLIKKYLKYYDYMYLITSRGCNFRCAFCYINSEKDGFWRAQSPIITVKQVKQLIDRGYRYIIFCDLNFFYNLKRVEKLIFLFEKNRLKFNWYASARIDNLFKMDIEFLKKLRNAGLDELQIGAESGSDRILKLLNKNHTVDMIKKVNLKLKKVGIGAEYNFMTQIPTETKKEAEMTLNLIKKLKKDNPDISIIGPITYLPIPGTALYKEAIKEGFINPKNLEEYAKMHLFLNKGEKK